LIPVCWLKNNFKMGCKSRVNMPYRQMAGPANKPAGKKEQQEAGTRYAEFV
jgi:hypothetical protein